ncbi:MAG: hypothetical protein K0Q59_54 [Paenibacillus sp.]|nr:hypothetical protein [Paenibacillus sp.]
MAVLIGTISQESNTFNPRLTTMELARSQHLYIGEQVRAYRVRDELGGFMAAAEEAGVEVAPSMYMKLGPCGSFAEADFAELKQLLATQVQAAIRRVSHIDGVFFSMHGAMVAQGCDDVEGELTGIVKEIVGGDVPFVLSLDPHANVTRRLIQHIDAIVAFQTYPHIDQFETGQRSAKLLFDMMNGELAPYMAMRKLPMIVPAENSQSQSGPFADLLAEARKGEQEGEAIISSILPLQPWLDIEELGATVVVVSASQEKADREADRLIELMWSKRHEFDIELHSVRDIVAMALADKAACPPGDWKPYIVSDSADSPGAGACGDSNFVLKEMLAAGAQERLDVILNIADAPAAWKATEAGVGAEVVLQVGHTINPALGSPVTVRGMVKTIGPGYFTSKIGRTVPTGRSVVLQIGTLSLVIHELPTHNSDTSVYLTMGLDPSKADIVCVRSANQFRDMYEPISPNIFILDSPGVSTPNLRSLRFEKIVHPFYPFEDDFDWKNR